MLHSSKSHQLTQWYLNLILYMVCLFKMLAQFFQIAMLLPPGEYCSGYETTNWCTLSTNTNALHVYRPTLQRADFNKS